jgi:ribonuclease PH
VKIVCSISQTGLCLKIGNRRKGNNMEPVEMKIKIAEQVDGSLLIVEGNNGIKLSPRVVQAVLNYLQEKTMRFQRKEYRLQV